MPLNKTEALRDAELRINQGQPSEAIAIYKRIIEADPFDLTTIGALSQLYVKTGRTQDAIDDFSRIAESYLDKGSPIKSAYILKKILELDPSNAMAHARIGEIYLHEGMSEKAYEAFMTAGVVFAKKGNVADALDANKKALAVKPDSRQAAMAIAALQAPKPETSESNQPSNESPEQKAARPLSESSHPRKPVPAGFDDAVVVQQISMAEYLVGYGKVEQAIALLKNILDHRHDHIDVREKLKDIYLRSEMMQKASIECFEIASIYASRGDTARAKDYTIRAQRLAQLFKQPDPPRPPAPRKAEPQIASSSSNRKEETETRKAQIKEAETRETQIKAAQIKIEPAQEPVALKAAPAATIREPQAAMKFIVEKTNADELPKPDILELETNNTALVLAPAEDRSLATVTAQTSVVSTSFPATTLGILLAPAASKPKTKRKTKQWLYAAIIALAILGAIAAAIFKGLPLYEARLDREYQALSQVSALASLPAPTDSAPVEESEPVEQMEVRATDSPSAQPNKPVRDEQDGQPARNTEPAAQPEQPSITPIAASESAKTISPSPTAPPPVQSAMSPQGGEALAPGGVPTRMPGNAAGLPDAPLPAVAVRQPSAMVKGESIKRVQPDYPQIARSTAQSGVVSVEVTISERGDVIAARAISGPPLLRESAVSAARRWKFKPSMRDSKPVVSTSVISFNFRL